MTILLCEPGDAAAAWLAAMLGARGTTVETITSLELGDAVGWHHEVGADGVATAITLRSGRVLASSAPATIVNRLGFVPLATLRATAGADLGYAVQEMFALYLSWLYAWPARVINRPTPQGLSGNYRHPSAWAALAVRAGLPVRPWRQSEQDVPEQAWFRSPIEATAFVVAETAVLPPGLPATLADGCIALAAAAETELLGIDFARDADGGWTLVGASPLPDLLLGGDPLVTAIAAAVA